MLYRIACLFLKQGRCTLFRVT